MSFFRIFNNFCRERCYALRAIRSQGPQILGRDLKVTPYPAEAKGQNQASLVLAFCFCGAASVKTLQGLD